MKKDITHLFCFVDDFVQGVGAVQLEDQKRKPTRVPQLTDSEIITILLLFQQSPSRHFKFFYHSYLQLYCPEFPKLPSYERFVALIPRVFGIMTVLLSVLLKRGGKGVHYIDSTSLKVCENKRNGRNKVFKGLAARGKTTKGWFFGFKLHVIVSSTGDLIRVKLTPGNHDDRSVLPEMATGLKGSIFGDKGYISCSLFLKLYRVGLKLVTGVRKSMKNQLMSWREKILLRKRNLIETVFDYLKNKLQIEHTRHRSPIGAFIHILATLITYQLKPTKPKISEKDLFQVG